MYFSTMRTIEMMKHPLDDYCKIETADEFFHEVEMHGEQAWTILRRCIPTLQDNKDIVLKSIELDPSNFYYASDRLKEDCEFVLLAISIDKDLLDYVSPEIQAICNGKNPVKALKASIFADELQAEMKSKHCVPGTKI